MMKRLLIVLPAVVLILLGCATPETVVRTVEVTVVVPVTVEVPATCPDCPTCLTCITCPTPCPSTGPTAPTEVPVDHALKAPKGAGSYMVGVDIAAGVWRSSGTGGGSLNSCYVEVKDLSGETEDIQGDPPGGTIRVPEGDWIVVFNAVSSGCTWTFLKP
jgi:hypothetical protein